jgi:cysteine sulfinate desulfinase/cysteine desulfurase-like protein
MESSPIYLDFNATTPLDESVIEVIGVSCRQFWANPSSSYESGRRSKEVVDKARKQIGLMIGAANPEREITFTSGGTEASKNTKK